MGLGMLQLPVLSLQLQESMQRVGNSSGLVLQCYLYRGACKGLEKFNYRDRHLHEGGGSLFSKVFRAVPCCQLCSSRF